MDYESLGFRCGIEIHQQLSGSKLFCRCPALNSTRQPDIRVERSLRAVAGETGEVDAAALHEMKKGRRIIYTGNTEDTCLVELDEEPPHPVSMEALSAALEVAQMLNAKTVDEVRVMRKTVVDGSNTSGFQRTALVGYSGYVETSLGRVGIASICLEEEAAQKLGEKKDRVEYRLDRLGIALIEIGTNPDIRSPEHAKETAAKLGMMLRSTGKVRRGLGTIRQDVNISIRGGARTEIKGFQDLRSIPKVIEHEVNRQLKLIRSGKRPSEEVRKAEPDFTTSFLRPMPGAARMYPETDIPPVAVRQAAPRTAELIDDRAQRYIGQGLAPDLAKAIAGSGHCRLYEEIIAKHHGLKKAFVAEILVSHERELARDYMPCNPALVTDEILRAVFDALADAAIAKESVMPILVTVAKGGRLDIGAHAAASVGEIEADVKKIVGATRGLSMGAVMGEVMKKYRGKVDGKELSELVKRLLSQ